jgi:septal ring factor EnvC (AmiA/AmiB activator)
MNNNWLKYLVALSAILIAGSAAYFSVTGLGVLFSGATVAVMIMAGSLELAKLVSATYLKQRWNDIKGFNKWYLSFAVGILMLITSAGIFGYLSNAFQQQNLALQQVDREILIHTTKIQQNESQIQQLSKQITEFNSNQGKIIDGGKVNSRLLRSIDNRDKQIEKLNDKISLLQEDNAKENDAINKIKTDNIQLEREVGGFRFVAEAFGVELNTVVKFFIILIVIVFDPLAIALIIAFNQLVMKGKNDENESLPEDLKNFVDETTRVHLSDRDLEILEKHLLNPEGPNEKLKEAAKRYGDKVREKHTHIDDFEFNEEKLKQREALVEMIKNDQELGLYDEPFDNELIKEAEDAFKKEMESVAPFGERYDLDDEVSDWDETLMDGLEEENNFQEEPTEEEESENFSTMEPNLENILQDEEYLTEAIREFNQQSFDDGEWTSELEEQFWKEQPPQPFATPEELNVDVQILNDTLNEVNGEIDNDTSHEDEKKN